MANRRRPQQDADDGETLQRAPLPSRATAPTASTGPVVGRDQGVSDGHHRGMVARLVRDKGFGFLKAGALEYFFHYSSCSGGKSMYDELVEGDVVEFDGMTTMKGPRATGVVRL